MNKFARLLLRDDFRGDSRRDPTPTDMVRHLVTKKVSVFLEIYFM